MLQIKKGLPPACIAELHRTPGATWASVSGEQKEEMRRALLSEQGHLCAYCMRRLANDRGLCTVEHWRPRSDPGTDPFEWHDLLAVCDGNTGVAQAEQHCDKHRGDAPLLLHPAHPTVNVEERLRYQLDGRIECADTAALNLNHRRLREGRKAVQDAIRMRCTTCSATEIRRLLIEWQGRDAAGRRKEYAGVALALLRQRLSYLEAKSKRTRGTRGQ